jgi:hypothetical protein
MKEIKRILVAVKDPGARAPICQCPRVCHPPSFWTAGHPVDTLPRLSRSIHAAILVLGAVSRALIGSTTRYLLDSVSCDLLIIKPARS